MSSKSDKNTRGSWVSRKLEDPSFRLGFEQELASEQFCDALEDALQEEGINRSELARRLGRSRPFVTKTLRRGANLTIRTMVELLRACGYELRITARRRSNPGVERTKVQCKPVYWFREDSTVSRLPMVLNWDELEALHLLPGFFAHGADLNDPPVSIKSAPGSSGDPESPWGLSA